MHKELLTLLRCPEDHSDLHLADRALVDRANLAIRSGELVDRLGRVVPRPLDGGLVRAAGDLLYPIVDNIPVLLRDEAISLAQLEDVPSE